MIYKIKKLVPIVRDILLGIITNKYINYAKLLGYENKLPETFNSFPG